MPLGKPQKVILFSSPATKSLGGGVRAKSIKKKITFIYFFYFVPDLK